MKRTTSRQAAHAHAKSVSDATINRKKCADKKRRERLEASPEDWLRWYLAGTYSRPFETPHVEIIRGTVAASETGGRFCVAAERGIGKSAILWGMILFLKLTGKRKFPVCVPWADKALKRAFRFWKNALCFNERLLADYPEFCQPFAHAKGVAQRVPNVRWEDTGNLTGAQLTVGEGLIVLPDGLGCLGGSTINGNIRGMNHPQEDGTLLRPDIVLLDDVQDRKVATSPVQVLDTIAIIDGDVAGCGDAGRDLPMLMACNCICKGDVAGHYLGHAEWTALRVPCIQSWPEGWNDKDSTARAAWDEWHAVVEDGGDDLVFYQKHRETMTRGMVLSAPAAFAGSDKCPDAFYGVIRMYFRMGRSAFMAERQQYPIDDVQALGPYTLTPEVIQSKAVSGRKVHERQEWMTRIVASTDCNPSRALSSALVGMGEDQTAAVIWYGLHPTAIGDDVPAAVFNRLLFDQLAAHGKALAALPVRPEVWAIDAGGKQFDAVVRFCEMSAQLCGIQAHAFTGRGSKNYRPSGKTAVGPTREQCHGCLDRKDGRVIRWTAWNADYWKEVAQRAWLGAVGSPGSLSLYEGNHGEFAAQVCGDKLMGKGEIGGQMIWNWHRVPGRNDFGDAVAQAYAAAAFNGIGTGGRVERKRKSVAVYAGGRWITSGETKQETTNHGDEQAKEAQADCGGNGGSAGAAGDGGGAAAGTNRPLRRAVIGRPGGGRW